MLIRIDVAVTCSLACRRCCDKVIMCDSDLKNCAGMCVHIISMSNHHRIIACKFHLHRRNDNEGKLYVYFSVHTLG